MPVEKIRILIADDHEGIRRGTKKLLGMADRFEVIGEAVNGEEAISKAKALNPDILLLDVELPVLSGLEVAQRLSTEAPDIKILALSSYDRLEYVRGMFDSGVDGYLTKDEAPSKLKEALVEIHLGTSYWMSRKLKSKFGSDQIASSF